MQNTVDGWAVTFGTARRGLGGAAARPRRPLFAVPNVTVHPSTATVPITVFIGCHMPNKRVVVVSIGPLLCGFNVLVKKPSSYVMSHPG